MAETTTNTNTPAKSGLGRRRLREEGRRKRKLKLKSDKEVAKAYHAGKSKRALERKAAFRKKAKGKK
jgi:hypothetical protein